VVTHSRDQGDSRAARRLNEPTAAVVLAVDETPTVINRVGVAAVRDEWRVVDRWWTEEPVSRRYFEVVLDSGRNVVVFRDELMGKWYRQQA
jgi:hypothetical protein